MLARKTHTKAHGFTLIELLVVVSIIALLVSILLPALNKAREHAKKSVCLSNLHECMVGVHMYAADWDDVIPPTSDGTNLSWSYNASRWSSPKTWIGMGRLFDTGIIDNPEVFYCPAQLNPQFRLNETPNSTWYDPVPTTFNHYRWTSYWYGFPGQIGSGSEFEKERIRLSNLKRQALLTDIMLYCANDDYPQETWPHSNGLDVGFGDGSSEFVPLSEEEISVVKQCGQAAGLTNRDLYIWAFFEWLSGKPLLLENPGELGYPTWSLSWP